MAMAGKEIPDEVLVVEVKRFSALRQAVGDYWHQYHWTRCSNCGGHVAAWDTPMVSDPSGSLLHVSQGYHCETCEVGGQRIVAWDLKTKEVASVV